MIPEMVREKLPAYVEKSVKCGGRENSPSLVENALQKRRWNTFGVIYIPDDIKPQTKYWV